MLRKNIQPLFTSLEARLRVGITQLEDKPEETVDSTLRALWLFASGNPVSVQKAHEITLPELSTDQVNNLEKYIEQRLEGIPLAHITKRQQFMDIEFHVGPEALVPRKETEMLGYAALKILNNILEKKNDARVIDVCTGSGNLAISLAYYQPKADIYASDLSNEAIEIAILNMNRYRLNDRLRFYTGDLFQPFDHRQFHSSMDLITCNPPYISSGKLKTMPDEIISYEPKMAFDGGPFGINILNRFIKEAPKYLVSEGWLAFEVGRGQGEHVYKRLMMGNEYNRVEAIRNNNGNIRAILVQVK